jgi:hypothetical protein
MELEQDGLKRQRSARRLRHEAQVQVFENQKGSLDEIRLHLGLRPSQICEILRVHPSAWTRWTRQRRAPPHVYQMLEWYIELLRWRGQHHPLGPAQAQSFVRKEDPETYVPIGDRPPEIPASSVRGFEPVNQAVENLQKRGIFDDPRIMGLLLVLSMLQTAVLAAVVIYLVNRG